MRVDSAPLGAMGRLSVVAVWLTFGLAAASLSACDGDTQQPGRVDFNLVAIQSLADSAGREADSMSAHADTMTSLAQSRADHAHWASDAATVRASAASVRLVGEMATAILRDQQAFPATAQTVDLRRLLGDGLNLAALGRTLADHAAAMSDHLSVMRWMAAGDEQLLSAIDSLAADIDGMNRAAQDAIQTGDGLADQAREIARGLGMTIE